MSVIEEFSYFKVDKRFPFFPTKEEICPNVQYMAKRLDSCYKNLEYFSGCELSKENRSLFSQSRKVYQFTDWLNGNVEASPFKEKEILEIKKDIESNWNSQSILSSLYFLLKLPLRIISIIDSYLEYFSFLLDPKKLLRSTDFYKTFISMNKLCQGVKKIGASISNKRGIRDQIENLLLGIATLSEALATLASVHFYYFLSSRAQIVLVNISFVGSLFSAQNSQEENSCEAIKERIEKVPSPLIYY